MCVANVCNWNLNIKRVTLVEYHLSTDLLEVNPQFRKRKIATSKKHHFSCIFAFWGVFISTRRKLVEAKRARPLGSGGELQAVRSQAGGGTRWRRCYVGLVMHWFQRRAALWDYMVSLSEMLVHSTAAPTPCLEWVRPHAYDLLVKVETWMQEVPVRAPPPKMIGYCLSIMSCETGSQIICEWWFWKSCDQDRGRVTVSPSDRTCRKRITSSYQRPCTLRLCQEEHDSSSKLSRRSTHSDQLTCNWLVRCGDFTIWTWGYRYPIVDMIVMSVCWNDTTNYWPPQYCRRREVSS